MHAKGGAEIDENTEEKKAEAITDHLVGEGCTVIHAHPERIQAMRHQTGQLGGLGELSLEDIQLLREQTAARMTEIEETYFINQEKKKVGNYFK